LLKKPSGRLKPAPPGAGGFACVRSAKKALSTSPSKACSEDVVKREVTMTPSVGSCCLDRILKLAVVGNLLLFLLAGQRSATAQSLSSQLTINGGFPSCNHQTVRVRVHAEDPIGILAYQLSESDTPTLESAAWTGVGFTTNFDLEIPFQLSGGDGKKTVRAWFRNATGKVSELRQPPSSSPPPVRTMSLTWLSPPTARISGPARMPPERSWWST